MKLSRGKQPPGLWHFQVAPGVRLEAINEEQLVSRIFEYRLRNNIPIGNIERDIDDYYCSQWPEACHKEDYEWVSGSNGANVATFAEPMLNRVTRWAAYLLHLLPRGGMTLVLKDEANLRGASCAGCPNNVPWRAGCPGCSNSTVTVSAQLRQLKVSAHHDALHACMIGGWDNQTAIWMPFMALEVTDNQKAAMPDFCWRKAA